MRLCMIQPLQAYLAHGCVFLRFSLIVIPLSICIMASHYQLQKRNGELHGEVLPSLGVFTIWLTIRLLILLGYYLATQPLTELPKIILVLWVLVLPSVEA